MAEAGLGFDAALAKIVRAQGSDRALVSEFLNFQHDMVAGIPRTQALRQLARRVDVASLTSFTSALIQAEQVTKFVEDVASDLPKYGLDKPPLQVTLSSFSSENTAETTAGEHPLAAPLINVVDTIGAGDAFTAAFVTCRLRGIPFEDCCYFGNALGALVSGTKGATSPIGLDEIYRFCGRSI
jgi:sugar/nucleoside kinase (ribokinase family)